MKLTTPVPANKANFNISHANKIALMGSCFAENIGVKLLHLKYDALINPFGIIYNPVSIANLLERIIFLKKFSLDDVFKHDELYFSFEHHSLLSSISPTEHLIKINKLLNEAHQFLKTSEVLIITFGTAFIYKYIATKQVVANCHKLPNTEFEKERLSIKDILNTFNKCLLQLFQFNTQIKVIFTVSPVRHVKDGVVNNTKSKAILHLAIDQLINAHTEKCSYFAAYEIMMDELRDYRFYKDDFLHPTALAVNYIWQHFENSYFNEKSIIFNKQIKAMLQQFNHKPFNANTQSHKTSIEKLIDKMQQFQTEHNIFFLKEIEQLNNNLNFAE